MQCVDYTANESKFYTANKSKFVSIQGQKVFLYSEASRPALARAHYVQLDLSQGIQAET